MPDRTGTSRITRAFIEQSGEAGNGIGFSVLEVIEAARKITGKPIGIRFEPRRDGDPARLIADASKAAEVLGWKPEFTELERIIESAWSWKLNNPDGYPE